MILSTILLFLDVLLVGGIFYFGWRLQKRKEDLEEKEWKLEQVMAQTQDAQKEAEELGKQRELCEKELEKDKIESEYLKKELLSYQTRLSEDMEQLRTSETEKVLAQVKSDSYILQQALQEAEADKDKKIKQWQVEIEVKKQERDNLIESIQQQIENAKIDFTSLIAPLKQYEKEQQDKLYNTIQIPEEYRDDIAFLLNDVSKHIQHKDIISKLVWNEYIKPNLDNTFKRLEIGDESGIYKLTSLINSKCYVGKSTNLKTRIANHFKSVVGIQSIADQEVHHVILDEGIWNWQIEKICECPKEELNEKEKFYISFFQADTWGHNKTKGG